MTEKARGKAHFLGLLANVNSSVTKLDLEHDFKIESVDASKVLGHISYLAGLSRTTRST